MYSVRSVRPLIDVDDMRSPTDGDTLRTVGLMGTEKFLRSFQPQPLSARAWSDVIARDSYNPKRRLDAFDFGELQKPSRKKKDNNNHIYGKGVFASKNRSIET